MVNPALAIFQPNARPRDVIEQRPGRDDVSGERRLWGRRATRQCYASSSTSLNVPGREAETCMSPVNQSAAAARPRSTVLVDVGDATSRTHAIGLSTDRHCTPNTNHVFFYAFLCRSCIDCGQVITHRRASANGKSSLVLTNQMRRCSVAGR